MRVNKRGGKLIRGSEAGFRENLGELRRSGSGSVGRGQIGLRPDDGGGKFLRVESGRKESGEKTGEDSKGTDKLIHGEFSQSRGE